MSVNPSFVIKNFTIYRRNELWIRHCFESIEATTSDVSKNAQFIGMSPISGIVSDKTYNSFNDGDFSVKTYEEDGEILSSLKSDLHGWVFLNLKDEYNLGMLYEINFDVRLRGAGKLDNWVNEVHKGTIIGPSQWRPLGPFRGLGYIETKHRYLNTGLSDPSPNCEIDNYTVHNFSELNCDFFEYIPAKASTKPKDLSTLRGYKTFQMTEMIGAEIQTKLRFYSAKEYLDFISNAEKVHVICDDAGVYYRGVLELGDPALMGIDLYEIKITLHSPHKLGVGWI